MRKYLVGTIGIACGTLLLLGCAADPAMSSSGSSPGSSSESASYSLTPPPTEPATATNFNSAGCRNETLDESLRGLVADGASLITGTLKPTGLVTTVDGGGLPTTFTQVAITDVAVLAGAAPATTVSAFVRGGQSADKVVTESAPELASAWADDHRVLGVLETAYGLPVVTTLPLPGGAIAIRPGSCVGAGGPGDLPNSKEVVSYRVFGSTSGDSGETVQDMGLTVSQHRESVVVVPIDDVQKLFESSVPSATPSS